MLAFPVPRAMSKFVPMLLVVSLLNGCAGIPPGSCARGAVSRLYLGVDTPLGEVTPAQWDVFVADVVTPHFPEGFTVYDGRGQWRSSHGELVTEHTRIVEFVHDGTPQQVARVRTLADDYKRSFRQQSVLVTQAPSVYCF